jgi:4'-phosphopantetheinyl transferase
MMEVDVYLASLSGMKQKNHSSVIGESLSSAFQMKLGEWKGQYGEASILGKTILQELLIHYGANPNDFQEMQLSKFGKPQLPSATVDFNISHSDDRVAVAIASQKAVGVDIERIRSINLHEYQREFTGEEWTWVMCSQNPEKSFFSLWTKKESFLKAYGMGLQVELSTVNVLKGQNSLKESTGLPAYWYEVIVPEYSCHVCTTSEAVVSVHEI